MLSPFRRRKLKSQASQLRDWRRSAQKVNRTWNGWLASDERDRDARHAAYVAALEAEERAADEVERMFQSTRAPDAQLKR